MGEATVNSRSLPPVLQTRSVLVFVPPGGAAATIEAGVTSATGGMMPIPLTGNVCGECGSLLLKVSVVFRTPPDSGANRILRTRKSRGAIVKLPLRAE